MSCCAAKSCEEFFTEKTARRDARRYRKKGLTGPGRRMVELLRRSLAGATVLEVGGGVGALHLELLKAGAERALNVELSPAYDAYARELAVDAGVAERVERRVLDFAEQADEIEAADVVVLNKVVCCYPDYAKLVSAAADRTRRYLLMSFPRDAWWTRLGVRAANLVERLRGHSFRAFVHPPTAIAAAAQSGGLRPVASERGPVWQLVSFERPSPV